MFILCYFLNNGLIRGTTRQFDNLQHDFQSFFKLSEQETNWKETNNTVGFLVEGDWLERVGYVVKPKQTFY